MKVKLFLSLLLFISATVAWGQTRQVSGRVISDSTNAGVAGVSVTLKGTKTSTATNNEGRYTISVPSTGSATLVLVSSRQP